MSIFYTVGGGKDGASKCGEPEPVLSTNAPTSIPEIETPHTIPSTSLPETKPVEKGTSSLPEPEISCKFASSSSNVTEHACNVAFPALAEVKSDRAPSITFDERQKIVPATSHLVHCNNNAAESRKEDMMAEADHGNN